MILGLKLNMPDMCLSTFAYDSPVTVECTAALEIIGFGAEDLRDYIVGPHLCGVEKGHGVFR